MKNNSFNLHLAPDQALALNKATAKARPVYGKQMAYSRFRVWLMRWAVEMVSNGILEHGPEVLEGSVIPPRIANEPGAPTAPKLRPAPIRLQGVNSSYIGVLIIELASGFRTTARLARTLETDHMAIHRHIDFMELVLGLPIEYYPRRSGYRLNNSATIEYNIHRARCDDKRPYYVKRLLEDRDYTEQLLTHRERKTNLCHA